MNNILRLIISFALILPAGCNEQVGDYVAASSISTDGFARQAVQIADGQVVTLWGYVDHSNLYGNAGTQEILADWWSSPGPDDHTWRFNLKAEADDEAGHSFPVHVPNNAGRDDLLRTFLADVRAQQPTRVFVTGRLYTFEAPGNVTTRTGLYKEAASAHDVVLAPQVREAK